MAWVTPITNFTQDDAPDETWANGIGENLNYLLDRAQGKSVVFCGNVPSRGNSTNGIGNYTEVSDNEYLLLQAASIYLTTGQTFYIRHVRHLFDTSIGLSENIRPQIRYEFTVGQITSIPVTTIGYSWPGGIANSVGSIVAQHEMYTASSNGYLNMSFGLNNLSGSSLQVLDHSSWYWTCEIA